jgi:hypothetical protein
MNAPKKFKSALTANRRSLIWLFVTYIPACLIAAYVSHWLWQTYLLGFMVAGGYMLWLLVIGVRMFLFFRQTG